LVDKNQALEVDDFAQTIKENQQLMKLGKGVRFICIKDINEINLERSLSLYLPMFPFYLDKPLGQLIFQTTIYRFASSSKQLKKTNS
jgi:hypothetical protein